MSWSYKPSGPGRREARARAIELLYEAEMRQMHIDDVLDSLVLQPDSFAAAAVQGVHDHLAQLDALIGQFARGWSTKRLTPIDRAILRLGLWELAFRDDVPEAVTIDEAVELAKAYSTEKAQSFINGVLDAAREELEATPLA